MSRAPFRLTSTIGRSYSVEPDDVLRTKKTLRQLGYFETPSYGMTLYPDEPMFKGIEEFQDDFDLYRDGVMNPDGETVEKLNEVLNYKDSLSNPDARGIEGKHSSDASRSRPSQNKERSSGQGERERDGEKTALAPAVPVIVYEIAAIFSMTVAAAYAWWLSLSGEERNQVRAHINNAQEHGTIDDPDDDQCERLFKIDMDTCRQISKRRGKRAAARCYASANERNAACRRGRSIDELPPLDTWNN